MRRRQEAEAEIKGEKRKNKMRVQQHHGGDYGN